MASIRKRGKKWQALVVKLGIKTSKTFDTKLQAIEWATQIEADIIAEKLGKTPRKTFNDALIKYLEEVSPTKKGYRWEAIRINSFLKQNCFDIWLKNITEKDFEAWRDTRLTQVSNDTVHREMALLSDVCSKMVKKWKWLKESPIANVGRPKRSKPRDRRITQDEIDLILKHSGYYHDRLCITVTSRIGACFIFAIETAMRAGEILKLTWDNTFLDRRFVRLLDTKNGHDRDVPLSSEAIRIINQMPKDSDFVFNINKGSFDSIFRKIKSKAGIKDLHFHDTRHEAITRLSKRFDLLELTRISGHRDLRMLQIYYNATAEELAKKMD